MIPNNYSILFKVPESHPQPDDADLAENTANPNLNSRDYAKRPLNHTTRMHESWECISLNFSRDEDNENNSHDINNIVVASNKLCGREWSSTLWGFDKDEVAKCDFQVHPEMSCFKLQCGALIQCMEFISNNILLVAFNSGKLQVWSTYSEVRNRTNPYCLLLIGEKCEHVTPITSMATFSCNRYKSVTGSKDGSIKIWDMSCADLYSQQTLRFSHTDAVLGLTTCYTNASIFASCSLDKSCKLWDDRKTRPAIALCESHVVRFKDVCWSLEDVENVIYLGDECGQFYIFDIRKPNVSVKCNKYFDNAIEKIVPKKNNIAIAGDTNIVKVFNYNDYQIFYEHADVKNIVRDFAWYSSNVLLSVGFNGKCQKHIIDVQKELKIVKHEEKSTQ